MARKKKTEPVEIAQEEPRQVARKKPDYMIAVTEEEYDAHREELEKLGNVLVCVDELDRDSWVGAPWRLRGIDFDEE
jgi:hypothetical protein